MLVLPNGDLGVDSLIVQIRDSKSRIFNNPEQGAWLELFVKRNSDFARVW